MNEMIAGFRDPYPDELLHSVFARYALGMGYRNMRDVSRDLFGDAQVIATIPFASHLTYFVTHLPPGTAYTTSALIASHTLLPFYAPFLPPERVARLEADMGGAGGPMLHTRSGLMASAVSEPRCLRYCPVCVAQDRARWGECYWHRVHQVAGVCVCPQHAVWLVASSVSSAQRRSRQAYVAAQHALAEGVCPPAITSMP